MWSWRKQLLHWSRNISINTPSSEETEEKQFDWSCHNQTQLSDICRQLRCLSCNKKLIHVSLWHIPLILFSSLFCCWFWFVVCKFHYFANNLCHLQVCSKFQLLCNFDISATKWKLQIASKLMLSVMMLMSVELSVLTILSCCHPNYLLPPLNKLCLQCPASSNNPLTHSFHKPPQSSGSLPPALIQCYDRDNYIQFLTSHIVSSGLEIS